MGGNKAVLAKKMNTDGKLINIKMYYWNYNINRYNIYKNNTIKKRKGNKVIQYHVSIYPRRRLI